MKPARSLHPVILPALLGLAATAALAVWFLLSPGTPIELRVPGRDRAPGLESGTSSNPVLLGKVSPGPGAAVDLPGAWPRFRGTNYDNINRETTPLLHSWQPTEPRELWSVDVGEGYAGPAVLNGRVYLMDYDRDKRQDALRCLSLADGKELWRFAYPVSVKRNHGMSRTVPTVTADRLVCMGPKCHVACLDPISGQLRWGIDLVREYGASVPQWYAGQCPLIETNQVILAPGGKNALLLAVDVATGKPRWQTANPRGWKMTHSSIIPMDFEGDHFYVYCADKGVVGVTAADGKLAWETTEWKISIATVPSPLILDGGRIFLTGGYNAGALMLQLQKQNGRLAPTVLFRLPPEVFGATQHTPVYLDGFIYGVRPDGRFACISPDGKPLWASDSSQQFGLGSFMAADGLIFAMNDSGLLRLIQPSPEKYQLLGQAQVLKGRESWGPLALAGGRLLARDFTRLVCLDVARH